MPKIVCNVNGCTVVEYREGKVLHRNTDDGPAKLERYKNGMIKSIKYIEHGIFHRNNGPALQQFFDNGNLEMFEYANNDYISREDGPAKETFYRNGKLKSREYWVAGLRHRIGGPAVEVWNETGLLIIQEYWVDDEQKMSGTPADTPKCEDKFKRVENWAGSVAPIKWGPSAESRKASQSTPIKCGDESKKKRSKRTRSTARYDTRIKTYEIDYGYKEDWRAGVARSSGASLDKTRQFGNESRRRSTTVNGTRINKCKLKSREYWVDGIKHISWEPTVESCNKTSHLSSVNYWDKSAKTRSTTFDDTNTNKDKIKKRKNWGADVTHMSWW